MSSIIFLGHQDAHQRGLRRKHHVLDAVALVIKEHVFHFVEFTVGRVAIEGLHQQVLAVSILLARDLELLLLGGEASG